MRRRKSTPPQRPHFHGRRQAFGPSELSLGRPVRVSQARSDAARSGPCCVPQAGRVESQVTVYVPHYAMSGGTLIALAADCIVMAPSAVLGAVDPQLVDMPAASILAAVVKKDVNEVDDRTLILADVARKAQSQVRGSVLSLLRRHLAEQRALETVALSEGRWTHDFPIDCELARDLGLPVPTDLPDEVRRLMSLYPQPRGRRPSVENSPTPYGVPQPRPLSSRRGDEQRSHV